MLFLRGKSANLLSIGAVDFGIIVDSSVIMVENIYRHLSAGDACRAAASRERIMPRLPAKIQRSLFFSTAIMVCAFLPLFTMAGPEGQIFGPMADTYAFALGGALLLARDALAGAVHAAAAAACSPSRTISWSAGCSERTCGRLRWCLRPSLDHPGRLRPWWWPPRWPCCPLLGREFMPELEEGNIWIRAHVPLEHPRWKKPCQRSRIAQRDHEAVSRGGAGALSRSGARRRHRPHRLLQRRVLPAAEAAAASGRKSPRRLDVPVRRGPRRRSSRN